MGEALNRKQAKKQKKRARRIRHILSIALGFALVACLFSGARNMSERSATVMAESEVTPEPRLTATPSPQASTTPAPTPTPTPTPSPTPEGVFVTISAAGDCTLGGEGATGNRFHALAKEKGLDYFFSNVREVFAQDDLTIVNLEGPLTRQTKKRPNRQFNFKGDPSYAGILSGGSVEVVTLANNHARDYLTAGYRDTKRALEDAGIGYCDASNACIREVKGVKVGFLGFHRPEHGKSEMVKAVKKLREACDVLIVSMHWGEESKNETNSSQRSYGRAAVEAGADLVLGHHPHVIQGIETYKGVNIVYSLGNFCFGGHSNPRDKKTFIYRETFEVEPGAGIVSAQPAIIPCAISSVSGVNDFRPTLATDGAAKKILKDIEKYSKAFRETLDFNDLAAQ